MTPSRLAGAVAHGVVLGVAFALLARSLALPSSVAAGAIGAVVASGVAAWAVSSGMRLRVLLIGSALLALGTWGLSEAWVRAELPARWLGLRAALEWAEGLRVGGGVLAAVLALRSVAHRYRVALVAEGALVVFSVASPVAAHRDGMIARPLAIADWFWRHGLDPVFAFLGLGLVGVVLFAGVLARDRRPLRTLAQVALVALLGSALALPLHQRSAGASLRAPTSGSDGGKDDASRDGSRKRGPPGERPGTAEDELQEQQQGAQGKQRPVAVVVFHKDVEPLGGVFYFRHAAFSQFNGTRLVESTRSDADQDVVWRFPSTVSNVPGPAEGTPARTWVATDVALLTEHRRMFALTDPVEVGPMANPAPARFKRAYRVVSSVVDGTMEDLVGHPSGEPSWAPDLWQHYTELPSDARYLELAARIDETLKPPFRRDPMARALAVKQYLEETTIYSFAKRYEGEDPTAQFLFTEGERRGFCTHIAHAAAFLLRAMDVPARVSAGYAVMSENLRGGSSLLVKSGDAHAWVEIYLESMGWIPVEIVPERTEFEPAPFEEEDLQRLLGEMARDEGRETLAPPESESLLPVLRSLMRAVPWMLVAAFVLAYAVRVFRRLRPLWTPEQVLPAYRAALDTLAAAGFVRRPGESRVRFARRVESWAPSTVVLTALLEGVVLGGHALGRAPGGRSAAGLVGELRSELGGRLPGWRRVLAALHPIPWFWAR